MIFWQIIIFFLGIIIIAGSISGYGILINFNKKKNFFLNIFLGLTVISFIITFTHFFFKITFLLSSIIFTIGFIFFLYNKNFSFLSLFQKKNFYYIIIIFLLIPIYLSQKYHEDFGYYHLPYAIGLIEEKIVFGFANIDYPYVYNSIWLNLYSIFFLIDKNFDFLTLPTYLCYLSFILFSINQVISKKEVLASDYFLVITLFYFILKFTRISEYGFDLPAIIFCNLSIYYFIRFSETDLLNKRNENFYLISIFSSFSILIKLSTIPIIILPLFLYIRYFKELKFFLFEPKFSFIYILLATFLVQQFIYTGCLFFPADFSCFNVSWFNESNLSLSGGLELVNKSYFHEAKDIYTPEEYLKNFNWIFFWIKRNYIEISEHLFTIILPSILFLFFLKNRENNFFLIDKFGLYIFLILGFLFWLNFSPVYRFGIYLFLTLIYVILINYLLSKKFSKILFLVFVVIFVFFSFSKNLLRINKTESIFLGIQKIDNKYTINEKYQNKYINVHHPDIKKNSMNGWQGRLCWNTPFICSYNKLDVRKKNGYLIINKLID